MNKRAVADILVRADAFAPFRFANRGKLLVVMYHRFSEQEEPGKTSVRTFEKHLRYLARHYRVIPLGEAVERLKNGEPFPARSAVITVDDGYDDMHTAAFPLLKKHSLPAAVYLVTGFVAGACWIWTDKARYIFSNTAASRLRFEIGGAVADLSLDTRESRLAAAGRLNSELKKLSDEEKGRRLEELAKEARVNVPPLAPAEYSPLSWDAARELCGSGIEIGSHTATHPILTNVDEVRLREELSSSKALIESEVQRPAVHFCYPNGDAGRRERDAAEAAGYESAVTTELRLCERNADRFLLPRIDAEPEMHRFVQATSGFDRFK